MSKRYLWRWTQRVAAALVAALLSAHPLLPAEEPAAPLSYDSKGKRDPFVALVRDGKIVGVPAGGQTRVSTDLPVLVGILWDPGGRSLALLNEQEVAVGDTIDDFLVAEIRRDAVVLMRGGEPVVLEISFEEPSAPEEPSGAKGGESW